MIQPQKILIKAIVVIAFLVVSINIFLYFGLTTIAKKFKPYIKQKTGIAIDFDRVWATLPSGTFHISGLNIANLDNFSTIDRQFISVGRGSANISLLALCLGEVNVSSINVKDARLTIVKNESGSINSSAFEEATKLLLCQQQKKSQVVGGSEQQEPANHAETRPEDATAESASQKAWPAMPRAAVSKARIDTIVEYIDRQASTGCPARIALNLKIKADDVTTFGDQEKETGSFSIKGHLDGKPQAFCIDLKGTIAPLNNPHAPTFTVEGTVTNICTADFKALTDVVGIESERIDLNVHMQCRNGIFVTGCSFLNAKISKMKVTGKSAGNMQGMSVDFMSVTIPVKGSIDAPNIDIIGALMANFTGNLDKVFRSINVDQKSVDKTINSFFNNILGGNKKK